MDNNLNNQLHQSNPTTFNNQTPPTKKNVMLYGIIGVIVVVTLVIIVSITFKDSKKQEKASENNNQTEINEDKENVQTEGPKYKSSVLNIDNDYDEFNGNIKDIDLDSSFIITNDNKIYDDNEFICQFERDVEKVEDFYTDSRTIETLMKNKDGSYSLYSNVSSSPDKESFNITLDNIIFASSIYVLTLEDGYIYYYELENGKLNNAKNRIYLDLYESDWIRENIYNGKIEEVYHMPNIGNQYFKLDNGRIMEFETSEVHTSTSEGSKIYYISASSSERLVEYTLTGEPVKIYGADSLLSDAWYSIQNDTNHIYLINPISPKLNLSECLKSGKTTAVCLEEVRISRTLPENYTTNDIKKVYDHGLSEHDDILLEMTDGNIYYFTNNRFELDNELSNLNKNKRIKKISTSNLEIKILCDDGFLYDYR